MFVQNPNTTVAKSDSATKKEVKVEKQVVQQTPTKNDSQTNNIKYIYHTVQKGDSLWGIANQYKGVTIDEIKKLNNLTEKSMLYVGQKLKVAIAS